ncbi:MAG: hypothetical protein VB948_03740, partial [Pseudomonadales bacterium]
GDTTFISGEVTACWYDEHAFVAISIVGRNQSNRVTTKGHALVVLPSTEHGAVTLPLFQGRRECWTSPPEGEE